MRSAASDKQSLCADSRKHGRATVRNRTGRADVGRGFAAARAKR